MPLLPLVVIALLLVGCAPAPRSARSMPRSVVPRAATETRSPPPRWKLRFEPVAATSRLRVTIEAPRATAWELPVASLHEVDLSPRRIAYEVAPSSAAPCPFEVTPDRAVFCGAAVLPRPRGDDAEIPLDLHLLGDPSYFPRVASSFGLGRHGQVRTTFAALGRAGFVFGRVHHARFSADEGRDLAAWIGFFAFDPRWVAAECAGTRTAVDRWLGIERPHDDAPVRLLLAGTSDTSGAVQVQPLRRGAFVFAGPSASWGARARLDVARLWAQRTLGATVTVDDGDAPRWFDEGIAHGVALTVLRDLGVLTPDEVAAEVTAWSVAEAFADLDEPAHAQAIRGALLALALDDAEALQPRLRRMVRLRAEGGSRVRSTAELLEGFDALRAGLAGARIPLRAETIGPCARVTRRRVHRFELGFVRSGDGTRVEAVLAGSSAARAGVREGDRVVALDYVPGASDVPVQLTAERDGKPVRLRYAPRGEARSADVFTVDPACAR